MKINLKNKSTEYLFILSEVAAMFLAAIIVFLTHIKIIPASQIWEWRVEPYDSFNSAFKDWVYLFTVFSFIVVFSSYSSKKSRPKKYYICPNCEEPQMIEDGQDIILCKKCGAKLVPLKGFYENKKEKNPIVTD